MMGAGGYRVLMGLAGAGLLLGGLTSCQTEETKPRGPVSNSDTKPWEPAVPTGGGLGGMPRQPRR